MKAREDEEHDKEFLGEEKTQISGWPDTEEMSDDENEEKVK